MKKVIGIVLGLCLFAVLVVWVLAASSQKEKKGAEGPKEAGSSQNEPPDDDASSPIVENYSVVDGEEITPEVGKATTTYRFEYPSQHLWVYGHAYAPPNLPRLELRFVKPSRSGTMEPCKLLGVGIEAWRDGGKNMGYRTDQELLGLTFKQQGAELVGAKAARILITDDHDLENFQGLYMGRMYYLFFTQLGYEGKHKTPDKWGSCIIRVPEDVPPGKVAVMEIDVTQKVDPYQVQMHTVTVHLDGDVPDRALVELTEPEGRRHSARVDSEGKAEISVEQLGGEMAVLSFIRQDVGHLLYYKGEVQSEEVRFPRDADLSVASGDVVNFDIEVPRDNVPTESHGLALLMRRDSSVPVAGAEFAEVEGWSRSEEDQLPTTVSLLAVPGHYYVASGFDAPKVIGKITVKQSDAKKTLEVQPLEE